MSLPQNLSRKFRAKAVAIGGAGSRVLEQLALQSAGGIETLAVHTNPRVLEPLNLKDKLLIGSEITFGLGAAGDPAVAQRCLESHTAAIAEFCQDADLLFVIAGMGGGTGSGAAPLIAQMGKSAGCLVLSVAILPFEFEGVRRNEQAESGLERLRQTSDAVLVLPNQKAQQLVNPKAGAGQAFLAMNQHIAEGVCAVWQMIDRPGLINVDFAYLYSILRGRHYSSVLATVKSSGPDCAKNLVPMLLEHPLMEKGVALKEAQETLVSIIGGPDMTILDINKIM
ncbi:MAG: hypothetical protein SFY81_05185, partial [Verrucomicrobiota bacterium]|nr:hypothetical protein [Verrucomicrobiota bacterium]